MMFKPVMINIKKLTAFVFGVYNLNLFEERMHELYCCSDRWDRKRKKHRFR